MKKALALLLSVLMIFSMVGVMAYAEDTTDPAEPTEEELVTVIFKDGDVILKTIKVKPGIIITAYAPENPEKPDTETTRYTFKGWQSSVDGEIYYRSTLCTPQDASVKEIVYTAVYSEKDISGRQTLWEFIGSIFTRINMIFEYFAKIFGWDD